MQVINSTSDDVPAIFEFYREATEHQKKVFKRHWQPFDRAMVEREVSENRQWKLILDNTIVCIFMTTFSDAAIWKEKDLAPSIYLHRICTHPAHRGKFFVKDIVAWAKEFGKQQGKEFIRMDTFGDNQKLIDYYVSCGFSFLGLTTMENTAGLPKHYEGATLSLFEIRI